MPDSASHHRRSGSVYDELFSDEWGTSWIVKGHRTAQDAERIIRAIEGSPHAEMAVREVRGRIGEKDGEPWFWLDADGPDVMWEVEYL